MRKALASFAIIVLAVTAAQAQTTVYSTDFNSPTYSDGPLIGQDGWAITGTSTVNPINVANTGTNGNVTLTTSGQDVNRTFTPVANPANASSVELFADITVASAGTGDYFLHLDDGTTTGFFDRVYCKAGSVAGTFDLGLGTGSGGTIVYGADLNFGTTYSIGAQLNFVAGATNDTGELFVNGNPYVAATTTGTDATQIAGVNLRQGSASSAAGVTVDNISVQVTSIPEPATWALMGIGLLVGVTKRIRRRA